jgi:MFS family permease
VAKAHLGGPAAWGAITASESVGLVTGGLVALGRAPRRPMLFGAVIALSPLSLAMLWPLPLICLASFGVGALTEIMMVQWTVAMARNIPPERLARVSAYDALGSMMAMPVGALAAGPVAAVIGVRQAQYAAAAAIIAVSTVALLPRDVRGMRAPVAPPPGLPAPDPDPVPET